jgi:hypothetical protein
VIKSSQKVFLEPCTIQHFLNDTSYDADMAKSIRNDLNSANISDWLCFSNQSSFANVSGAYGKESIRRLLTHFKEFEYVKFTV